MRTISRRGLFGAACLACGGAHLGLTATPVQAQQQPATGTGWSPPPSNQRCPSRFGAEDTRGYMNLVTHEKRKAAAQLIRNGTVVELGRRLEQSMPFFGTRRFDIHLKRTFMNPEPNRRGSNEEIVILEIGQVGTQLDGFPHQTIGDEVYNCIKYEEIATRSGFRRMGVGTIGTVFTRRVLIDGDGAKGERTLRMGYEITVADLEQPLQQQTTRIARADVVVINTD